MGTTAQKLEYLQGTKNVLKTQLTAKGVAVPSNTTFRQMANLVGTIRTGQIVETKTVTLSENGSTLSATGFSFTPTWAVALKMTNPGNYRTNTITSVIATESDVRMAISGMVSQGAIAVELSAGSVTFTYTSSYFRPASYLVIAGAGEPPEFPTFE